MNRSKKNFIVIVTDPSTGQQFQSKDRFTFDEALEVAEAARKEWATTYIILRELKA